MGSSKRPRGGTMRAAARSSEVDRYVSSFPAEVQRVLQKVRQTIRKAAPMATERISYGIPSFFLDGVIVHFGAFKGHIGLYPPVRDPELANRIAIYRGEKGNLRFPLDQPIPYDLIGDIVKSRRRARGSAAKASAAKASANGIL